MNFIIDLLRCTITVTLTAGHRKNLNSYREPSGANMAEQRAR